MEALSTVATTALTGIAAVIFTIGAIKIGIPAAKFTVNKIAGLFG